MARHLLYLLAAVGLGLVGGALSAHPIKDKVKDRPEPKAVFEWYPDYSGPTNWGFLSQRGKDLALSGNPQWAAFGVIRPDGKVEFTWIYLPTGEEAVSVYETDGYRLEGRWGWSAAAEIVRGEVTGTHHHDVIRSVEPPPPPKGPDI